MVPTAGTSRPDLLCLDRDFYERGRREIFERFRKRIRSIADRCTAGAIKHKNLCEWSIRIK